MYIWTILLIRYLVNVLDGLDDHLVLDIVADNAGITGVVEHGQGGVDGGTDVGRLGPLLAILGLSRINTVSYTHLTLPTNREV